MLVPIGETGALFRGLEADAFLAADEADAERMVDDLLTLFRAAEHLREIPFLVSDLRALSRFTGALYAWGRLLEHHPEQFSDADLRHLEQAAHDFAGGTLRARYEAERFMFYDLVQRLYSDDGRGDGCFHFTEHRRFISDHTGLDGGANPLQFVLAPVMTHFFYSRRTVVAAYDRYIDALESESKLPYWQGNFSESDALLAQYELDPKQHVINLLAPTLKPVWQTFEQAAQQRDALIAASALHRYRLDHGRWPTSLTELVPKYLPDIPVDRLDGKPLRYRVVEDRQQFYSVGLDGKDDGGRAAIVSTVDPRDAEVQIDLPWHFSFTRFCDNPPDGDLILWPVEPPLPEMTNPPRKKFNEFGAPIP